MPVTRTLPDEWYNTANIHLCTIKDFVNFSKTKNFKLSKSIALKSDQKSFITNIILWDHYGRPIAIAALSKPLMKGFDR